MDDDGRVPCACDSSLGGSPGDTWLPTAYPGIDQILPRPSHPRIHESFVQDARDYARLAERANGPSPQPGRVLLYLGDALEELDRAGSAARVVNVETSITRSDDWVGKGINHRMHPENVPTLTAARIDVAAGQLRNDLALMYFVVVSPEGELLGLRMTPMQIRRFRLHRASPADAEWLRARLNRVYGPLGSRVRLQQDGSLALEHATFSRRIVKVLPQRTRLVTECPLNKLPAWRDPRSRSGPMRPMVHSEASGRPQL